MLDLGQHTGGQSRDLCQVSDRHVEFLTKGTDLPADGGFQFVISAAGRAVWVLDI